MLALAPVAAQRLPDVRQPYNGLWYDRAEPGTGVTISTQGDLLVALIYTYRPDGAPLWLLASGTLRNSQFDAPLTEFRRAVHRLRLRRTAGRQPGPARPVAPGENPRGPNLLLGFQTADAGLFRDDPREPIRCR